MTEVDHTIYVAIRTAPLRMRKALTSKFPVDGDQATRDLVDRILSALEGYEIRKVDRPQPPGHRADCGHPGKSRSQED